MSIRKRKKQVEKSTWFKRVTLRHHELRSHTAEYTEHIHSIKEKTDQRTDRNYERWSLLNYRRYRIFWAWSDRYDVRSAFKFNKFRRMGKRDYEAIVPHQRHRRYRTVTGKLVPWYESQRMIERNDND